VRSKSIKNKLHRESIRAVRCPTLQNSNAAGPIRNISGSIPSVSIPRRNKKESGSSHRGVKTMQCGDQFHVNDITTRQPAHVTEFAKSPSHRCRPVRSDKSHNFRPGWVPTLNGDTRKAVRCCRTLEYLWPLVLNSTVLRVKSLGTVSTGCAKSNPLLYFANF